MRNASVYFSTVLCFLACGLIVHIVLPYDVISLEVNKYNTRNLNLLFKYITLLGDGFFIVALGIVMRWINKGVSQKILVAYCVVSIVCSFMKQWLFRGMPRPIEHFRELYPELNLVDGVQLSHWNTFPSGHSALTFMIFTVLALWTRNPWIQIVFAVLAILAGFSRVYLFEHFLRDVLAGAIIGCSVAIMTEYLFKRWNSTNNKHMPIANSVS